MLILLAAATVATAELAVHGVSESFGMAFVEANTRISVSGSVSNLTVHLGFCDDVDAAPPVEFVVVNHVSSDGTAKTVCRLDKIDGSGAGLGSIWTYQTPSANYRRTGCAELAPGTYLIGAGAVGDALDRFAVSEDGNVVQPEDSYPEPPLIRSSVVQHPRLKYSPPGPPTAAAQGF